MFKVGKSLPVVLVLFVASAQASEAPAAPVAPKVEAPAVTTPAPDAEAKKVEASATTPAPDASKSDVKADDKDATKKAGIMAATVGAVTGSASWAKELWISDNMKKNNVCYYSAQTAKVIAALAVVYGSYRLAKLAYDKYYATEEETSYDYELNS